MLDSGNFVLYDSNHEIIWQSFEHPTDTLLPGQRLLAGQELFSSISETNHSTGKFRLKMQHDGHLVQYPVRTPDTAEYSYWASGTMGSGDNVSLNLNDDGHLYLLNATGFNIRNLTDGGYPTQETIYRMKIDVDGIFRLYSHRLDHSGSWSIIWSSSNDRCNSKGLCGLNSYCVLMDQEAVCRCLSGFDFVDTSQQNSDCERNFTTESCKNKNGSTKYDIKVLENVTWHDDDSYSIISLTTEENCKEACLGDCNCEAALFKDRECRKQKLPLRYGRRSQSDSTTTFVKVGESATTTRPTTGSPHKESKKVLRMDILIISVSLVTLSFLVFAISGALIYRNHVWAYKKISEKGNVELSEDVGPRAFTYAELEQVTNGFKEEVGRGSFGTVYKGTLSENQKVVAVKRLDKVSAKGEREFQTEMRVIGKTHHRNLVRLLGYCHDGPKRLLVYEYMHNGSLADILFTPENQPSWDERIGIALDIARGILYLHEECETQIIHCDIKPQNILMDEHRHAKIADFGLAKLLKPDQTNTFTGIRGTRGYVAPEWHRNLPVTVKADVYSFGIVLLEIICCRRSVEWSLPEDEAVLEQWVDYCFQARELGKLVGGEEVDKRKLERMVKVGLWCILDEPSLRPSMKKVLLMLEGTVDIPVPPSLTSFLSAI
uniref:non-specific serine/threonine protein kinase n=1 Tax=Davidia involucrata TaxID=16924 RepID=A0A5B7BWV4_DAVIN